jgi:hypothetical protein
MIEVFVLIGWVNGFNNGGIVIHEFNSLATCEAAKTLFIEKHKMKPKEERYSNDSWVECVKK